MPEFIYRAVDSDGKAVDGTMDETSAHRVAANLREKGLQVNSVKLAEKPRGLPFLKPRLTWDDIDLLNEQLRSITKSGLPLAASLKTLGRDVHSRRFKSVVTDIAARLDAGESVEDAFAAHPGSFPPVYLSMLRAGARTGNLSGVLNRLCAYSSRMVEVKNNVHEAIAYPIMVVIVAVFIVGFLLAKVVPTFAEIFGEFGSGLPAPTQFLVDVSYLVSNRWPALLAWIGAAIVGIHLGLKHIRKSVRGACFVDRLRLYVPVFGRIYSAASMARFSQSLGLLLSCNVPVVESLELAGASADNALLARAAADASVRISGGEKIADALGETGRFSYTFCWMLGLAEDRGDVDETLIEMADAFERTLGRWQRVFSTLVGPAIIVTLGFVVGFIVVALYLPIFTLGDAISL
ncbi:MAG: type II secretion system F family protein [Candidatus Hydrogenedentes bacterium]|nr:type II secretion system F family protein [Candidatus Hydrogenedentota bacterium]